MHTMLTFGFAEESFFALRNQCQSKWNSIRPMQIRTGFAQDYYYEQTAPRTPLDCAYIYQT